MKDNIILIDDSYNSSPKSVNACFDTVNAYKTKDRRTVVILGDRKELGDDSIVLHRNLAADAVQAKIDKIYTVGSLMESMSDALPTNVRGIHTNTSEEMANVIIDQIQPNDVIAIKGSLSMNMMQIVSSILKHFAK